MAATLKHEATKAAEEVLVEYWNGTIPVDPARVAHGMGLRVVEAYLDPDVAGAIRRRTGEAPSIYLNVEDSRTRKRFTCAHEIGHFVKRSESGDFEFVDYRAGLATTGQDTEERYANAFAAALLMPEQQARRLREQGRDERDMARVFGVSEEAMVNRLKNLGLYR